MIPNLQGVKYRLFEKNYYGKWTRQIEVLDDTTDRIFGKLFNLYSLRYFQENNGVLISLFLWQLIQALLIIQKNKKNQKKRRNVRLCVSC